MSRSGRWIPALGLFLALAGCRNGLVMLERPKGQIELRRPETLVMESVRLNPATASVSQDGLDVTVRYASAKDLEVFFKNAEIFGKLAGHNPYPEETVVFFVRIANHSGKKIRIDPANFVLIDNLNIQYTELSADDISALLEARVNLWAFAKTTGDLAPGYYGAPLKVAGALGAGGGGRKLHYLVKQVRLAPGYVFPGIAYDGYVAFPRPHPNATSLRLLVNDVKTDFNAADLAQKAIDFEFPFTVEIEKSPSPPPPPSPSS